MKKKHLLPAVALLALPVCAQEMENDGHYNPSLSGSVQSDMLVPQGTQSDGSHENFRTNTYLDLNFMSKFLDAGGRFSYLDHPLPGFEKDFKGWGVPYFYLKAKFRNVEVTGGNFYEQFGSGFILRTYEERSLGIDNSLFGARAILKPIKGVRLKGLAGRQRRYWNYNHAWLAGADLELSIDQWVKALEQSGTYLTLGGSYLNKREGADEDGSVFYDATHKLNFPTSVDAWDIRANLQKGPFSLLAEYAQKTQDPSFDNGYIYRKGYAAMLSASYSKKGFSVLAQAKRTDNMSSRSRRQMNGSSSFIDHMPAFAYEHTYTLAALYPYATQLAKGEWAYQGQVGYNFKRRTLLGGKYGTGLQVNFSHIHSIAKNPHGLAGIAGTTGGRGTDGYGSAFWKWGDETYYQDFNVQLDKRLTRNFKLHLMYMNQLYNKTAVEGEGGKIRSNIFVADAKYQFSPKTTLRAEAQYLTTPNDEGDWAFGLLELSLAPHWMFTVSDEYNVGKTHKHYWNLLATYNVGSHRIQAGYVRTRAGYNCSGGVCRYVPSYQGWTVSYNYNF